MPKKSKGSRSRSRSPMANTPPQTNTPPNSMVSSSKPVITTGNNTSSSKNQITNQINKLNNLSLSNQSNLNNLDLKLKLNAQAATPTSSLATPQTPPQTETPPNSVVSVGIPINSGRNNKVNTTTVTTSTSNSFVKDQINQKNQQNLSANLNSAAAASLGLDSNSINSNSKSNNLNSTSNSHALSVSLQQLAHSQSLAGSPTDHHHTKTNSNIVAQTQNQTHQIQSQNLLSNLSTSNDGSSLNNYTDKDKGPSAIDDKLCSPTSITSPTSPGRDPLYIEDRLMNLSTQIPSSLQGNYASSAISAMTTVGPNSMPVSEEVAVPAPLIDLLDLNVTNDNFQDASENQDVDQDKEQDQEENLPTTVDNLIKATAQPLETVDDLNIDSDIPAPATTSAPPTATTTPTPLKNKSRNSLKVSGNTINTRVSRSNTTSAVTNSNTVTKKSESLNNNTVNIKTNSNSVTNNSSPTFVRTSSNIVSEKVAEKIFNKMSEPKGGFKPPIRESQKLQKEEAPTSNKSTGAPGLRRRVQQSIKLSEQPDKPTALDAIVELNTGNSTMNDNSNSNNTNGNNGSTHLLKIGGNHSHATANMSDSLRLLRGMKVPRLGETVARSANTTHQRRLHAYLHVFKQPKVALFTPEHQLENHILLGDIVLPTELSERLKLMFELFCTVGDRQNHEWLTASKFVKMLERAGFIKGLDSHRFPQNRPADHFVPISRAEAQCLHRKVITYVDPNVTKLSFDMFCKALALLALKIWRPNPQSEESVESALHRTFAQIVNGYTQSSEEYKLKSETLLYKAKIHNTSSYDATVEAFTGVPDIRKMGYTDDSHYYHDKTQKQKPKGPWYSVNDNRSPLNSQMKNGVMTSSMNAKGTVDPGPTLDSTPMNLTFPEQDPFSPDKLENMVLPHLLDEEMEVVRKKWIVIGGSDGAGGDDDTQGNFNLEENVNDDENLNENENIENSEEVEQTLTDDLKKAEPKATVDGLVIKNPIPDFLEALFRVSCFSKEMNPKTAIGDAGKGKINMETRSYVINTREHANYVTGGNSNNNSNSATKQIGLGSQAAESQIINDAKKILSEADNMHSEVAHAICDGTMGGHLVVKNRMQLMSWSQFQYILSALAVLPGISDRQELLKVFRHSNNTRSELGYLNLSQFKESIGMLGKIAFSRAPYKYEFESDVDRIRGFCIRLYEPNRHLMSWASAANLSLTRNSNNNLNRLSNAGPGNSRFASGISSNLDTVMSNGGSGTNKTNGNCNVPTRQKLKKFSIMPAFFPNKEQTQVWMTVADITQREEYRVVNRCGPASIGGGKSTINYRPAVPDIDTLTWGARVHYR